MNRSSPNPLRGHSPEAGEARDPLGAVAATAAQEIGTALTAIQVASERLEQACEGEGAVVHEIEIIRDQSRRLARLARLLLEFAHPPPGPSTGTIDLAARVRAVLPSLERTLARQGIELRIAGLLKSEDERGPRVHADLDRFNEVLVALVGNATTAATASPPPRWVRVEVREGVSGKGELRVGDSGPGVPSGAEERIFFPFVSGWGGEGMGLFRSRLSATGQGGRLHLTRDEEGEGTEFVLTLEREMEED